MKDMFSDVMISSSTNISSLKSQGPDSTPAL
jgi:hypothetical protein